MENTLQWVERSRSGDRDAFARIIEHYQGMVSAVTLNLSGDFAQSEDLAQETFLTAWRKLPELREPEKLASWIYGIAKRTALHWREKQQRNPLQGASEIDGETAVDPRLERERTRQKREQSLELVWSTVKELPETLREPLLLYYRYSKSVADIAASMGLTDDAVNQRLSRGRKMLKAEVEKQVESVLEATKPGEYFVVGVLAAIPVFATGKQALAAGTAGAAVAKSTSSAGGASSLLTGITTSLGALVSSLGPFLVISIGTFLGVWSLVRHAPTCTARRFMIKTILEYCVVCSAAFFFYYVYLYYNFFRLYRSPYFPLYELFCYFCVAVFPVLVLLNTIRINRQWRQIVEYDQGTGFHAPKITTWKNIFLLFAAALLIQAVYIGWFVSIWHFEIRHTINWIQWFTLLSIPVALMVFLYCGWKISRDETAFQKTPPRLPNLLQILTGEQPWPKGFRNRIHFWGDLTAIGGGMFIMQGCYIGWYLWFTGIPEMTLLGFPIGNGCYFSVVWSLLIYMVFVLFFAGIPRRRYWGMVFLGGSMFTLNTFMICYSRLWLYVEPSEFTIVFGLHFWYTLCLALLGVAGLVVFRKRKLPITIPPQSVSAGRL